MGLDEILDKNHEQRKSNSEKWKNEEHDGKLKPHTKHRHHHEHDHDHHHDFDHHHNHDDWTY